MSETRVPSIDYEMKVGENHDDQPPPTGIQQCSPMTDPQMFPMNNPHGYPHLPLFTVFKISLSVHYTGWFIGIPLLDYYEAQYIG